MKLSLAQRIAKFFTSKATFEKFMNESKRYKFDCSSCGRQSDIWEIGGIRYKAYGKPASLVKCPQCGKVAMRKIYKV